MLKKQLYKKYSRSTYMMFRSIVAMPIIVGIVVPTVAAAGGGGG